MRLSQAGPSNHYTWGDGCDGWRLVDDATASLIEERMPAAIAEQMHVHARSRQIFHVLSGVATMRTPDGEVTARQGQAIVVEPGSPHQMRNDGADDLRFLVFSTPSTKGDRRDMDPPAE